MIDIASLTSICDEKGAIHLPKWVRRVKIDIGLSCNAPQAKVWLENNQDLFVIGIEPNRRNILNILTGMSGFPNRIDWDAVSKKMYLLPYAVSNRQGNQSIEFFDTVGDGGQSSVLKPKLFGIKNTYHVKTIMLSSLIQGIISGGQSFIEHIKSDCQGYDLEVLKSAGKWLTHVAMYTFEFEPSQYHGACQDFEEYDGILTAAGFVLLTDKSIEEFGLANNDIKVEDPTYVNKRYLSLLRQHKTSIYQVG